MKQWIEVSLVVTEETEDVIANFLFELGAAGCYNQEGILCAYFHEPAWSIRKEKQLERYLLQLAELHFPVVPGEIRVRKIEDRDWNAQWKGSIQPIEIAGKIVIRPSWITLTPDPLKIVIEIDPQMAFGTGVHATTQLMLKLMMKHRIATNRVLDIGTGTGILAIAAALLSSAEILAYDNDPVAVQTARQNCVKNQVANRIHLFCGTLDAIKNAKFDLILANINRTIIIESLASIYRYLNDAGLAIFSGILIDDAAQLVDSIAKYNLKIRDRQQQDEWVGVVVSGE